MITESEAISSRRESLDRTWNDPLPALITDGRLVLGACIYPEHGGHTMEVTGRNALAGPDGSVDEGG